MNVLDYKNSKGITQLTLGLDMTVYVRRSFYDCADGIISFYRRAMQEIGDDVKWYFTETMARPRKVSPETLDMVPSWFSNGAKHRKTLQMTLFDGSTSDEIVPRRFQMLSSDATPGKDPGDSAEIDTGVLQLVLPPEKAQRPDEIVDLFIELIKDLPFISGHVGYGLVWDELAMDLQIEKQILKLSQQYPALDIYGFLSTGQFVRSGIKCVNWLTLLGDTAVKRLGAEPLNKLKVDGVAVRKLNNGILIRASESPLLGDVNTEENISPYHKVGTALRSIRDVPDDESLYPFVGNEKETLAWLARFDR